MATDSSSTPVSHLRPQSTGSSTINANDDPTLLGCTCTQYNAQQTRKRRNLVVCIDGTSNKFGQNNTNVVKLFAKVDDRPTDAVEQLAFYSSGIGTRPQTPFANLKRTISDKLDMAIAWNVEEIVKDAYGWLGRMYREGDRIYLFGFSRGAYQVRVLAGMIYEVGLIKTVTEKGVGTAYTHYYNTIKKPEMRRDAREFRDAFSQKNLHRVHFVGVWDTVSSVGFTRGNVFLSASSSAAHACHFRHALALDERRVKFMPEYFHEMNIHTGDGNPGKSKYADSPDEQLTGLVSERLLPTETDSGTGISFAKQRMTTDVKEVWFAGSHSDVGGMDRLGAPHQAGNVSLLWMRREATEKGLVLLPTDIVWMPDDLDFGVNDSMDNGWGIIEHLPIKHQVSFSGAGENAVCFHRGKPRRIIPGQKVHNSILFANTYKPQASLGEGFDVPILRALFDGNFDKGIWDTSYLFDVSTAQTLVDHLDSGNVSWMNLDRLLFMLQFEKGKEHIRKVPDWRGRFLTPIHRSGCRPLVRLVAVIAYYEASDGPKVPMESIELCDYEVKSLQDTLEEYLKTVPGSCEHVDGPSILYLLGPLAKHKFLRECLLTEGILKAFIMLLDSIILKKDIKFGKMMGTLSCLLQCEDIRNFIIDKLGENHPHSRLAQILKVKGAHHLIAALRMVSTLARTSQAANVCSSVKPQIRKLAACRGPVGPLAIGILLILYDPNDPRQVNTRNPFIRENFATALLHLSLNPDKVDSVNSMLCILSRVYGFDAEKLTLLQKKFISGLAEFVRYSYLSRQRTAATMTLLKLCEAKVIRAYLLQINLLDILVDQLHCKDEALLAAYALASCLKYSDMEEVLKKNECLSKNIVHMLKWDYFDDALGSVEGFQIFRDFMQCTFLREKIKENNIAEILKAKLGKGVPKETRTSLILLDIFCSFDLDGPWTHELVDGALKYLRSSQWNTQKAGVMILSALAQTDYGVDVIHPRLHDVFEMLSSSTNHSEPASLKRRPSSMLGPAYTLCILAQNKRLRGLIREMSQYTSLKHLYSCGAFIDNKDTHPWQVYTPNRADIVNAFDKMMKIVDGGLFEEGSTSTRDSELPDIRHWDHLLMLLGSGAIAIALLPALLGFSAVGLALNLPPITVSATVLTYKFFKTLGPRILRELSTPPEPPGGSD